MAYVRANRWMIIVALYLVAAVALRLADVADIFPPCLVSKVIGRPCPGCGLTRAGLSLMKLDFRAAWDFNPTIYLVLPAGLYFLIGDLRRFYRNRAVEA